MVRLRLRLADCHSIACALLFVVQAFDFIQGNWSHVMLKLTIQTKSLPVDSYMLIWLWEKKNKCIIAIDTDFVVLNAENHIRFYAD